MIIINYYIKYFIIVNCYLVFLGRESILNFSFINSKLDGLGGWFGSEIIHPRLEATLPSEEVHGTHLAKVGFRNVDVQGLRLVNEGSSVSSLFDDSLLGYLPDCLVELLDMIRNDGDVLDTPIEGDNLVLEVISPDAKLHQVLEKMLVDDLELPAEHPPGVDVAGVGLHGLVVAEDLRRAGRGHGGHQQAVPDPVLRNLGLEAGPVVEAGGLHVPHVVLEDALGDWRAGVCGVGSFNLSNLT